MYRQLKKDICSKCNKEKLIYNVKSKLCKYCYNYSHHDKKKDKLYQAKWKSKNPDYWKDYWLIHRQLKFKESEDEEGREASADK